MPAARRRVAATPPASVVDIHARHSQPAQDGEAERGHSTRYSTDFDVVRSGGSGVGEARGLVNRGAHDRPERPIALSTLNRILSHLYYVGIVVYKGAFYEGAHLSLIPRELWLRVQDALAAHNSAGEKDRRHPHYLKGTIYRSECGNRLVFTRDKGKLGAYYDYFSCLGRRASAAPYTRKYLSVEAVERGVEDFYLGLHFSPERIDDIRRVVREELANSQADARFTLGEARRRHTVLKNEQAALMKAHYAGAVPLDILKSEMDRITREVDAAEHQSPFRSKPSTSSTNS